MNLVLGWANLFGLQLEAKPGLTDTYLGLQFYKNKTLTFRAISTPMTTTIAVAKIRLWYRYGQRYGN